MTANLSLSASLITEQFAHAVDRLKADTSQLRAAHENDRRFIIHRVEAAEKRLDDHEGRLRSASEGVTTFKAYTGFLTLLSALLSIAAIIRSFLQ
jgi:hypothetical protein